VVWVLNDDDLVKVFGDEVVLEMRLDVEDGIRILMQSYEGVVLRQRSGVLRHQLWISTAPCNTTTNIRPVTNHSTLHVIT
jgi:ribosomal protein L19